MPDKHLPVRLRPVRQQLRRPDRGQAMSCKLELRGGLIYYGSQAAVLRRQTRKVCAKEGGSRLRTRP